VPAGTVAELWRFPVKSMAGARAESLPFVVHGVPGDRQYALVHGSRHVVVTHQTHPELLLVGVGERDGQTTLLVPGASEPLPLESAGPALGAFLRADVMLVSADDHEADATPLSYDYGFPVRLGGERTFYDEPSSVHLISTASLAWLADDAGVVDNRRTRANVVLDLGPDLDEGDLVGRCLVIGSTELEIVNRTERCELMDRELPGTRAAPRALQRVREQRGGTLGVYAQVTRPGVMSVGDDVLRLAP